MRRQHKKNRIGWALFFGCLWLLFSLQAAAQTCTVVDLAQTPLEALAPSPAPANVVFLLDDSTRMDAEVLLSEEGPLGEKYYLFDNAGDNATTHNDFYCSQEERKYWRYQWHGYNRLYYNPTVTYEPWPDPGDPDQTMTPANNDKPQSNPMLSEYTQNLDDPFTTLSGPRVVVDDQSPVDNHDPGSVSMTGSWDSNSTEHFTNQNGATFTWNVVLPQSGLWGVWVSNLPGDLDSQAVYEIEHTSGTSQVTLDQNVTELVELGSYNFGANATVTLTRQTSNTSEVTNADQVVFQAEGETIPIAHYYLQDSLGTPYLVTISGGLRYFRVEDQAEGQTGHGIVEDGELVAVAALPGEIDSELSYAEERQNFANWYSFHRKRSLAATSAVAKAIVGLEDMQVGFLTLNSTLAQPVLPIQVENDDQTGDVLRALYPYAAGIETDQETLLRAGLDCVGRYYSADLSCNALGDSPMAAETEGGACQKQFVVIVTHGAYDGTTPSDIGNQDGNQSAPYADGYSNTLADVAMKYYKDDLSSAHEGMQQMHTFAVGFGVKGSLERDQIPDNWPEPLDDATKIDDLWHATVNGRGEYYPSDSPDELNQGLEAIKESLLAFSGSSASVSATGEAVEADNTVFVPSYDSEFWAGDMNAYTLGKSGATALKWSAAQQMEGIASDDRNIYTFNGTSGIEFEFGSTLPHSFTEDEINYLRGDQSKEQKNGGLFRNRTSLLGDIIHSASVYHNETVYVGANDGMLHAFNAADGGELFAYVPSLVFSHLTELTYPNYIESHRYFVDLTPAVGKVGTSDYLVGGLGAGGKGYFCLDVTHPFSFGSSNVRWEFPNSSTSIEDVKDVGFSFSRAMIVETKAGTKVLFGNGYNSDSGHAVFFVLDSETGDVETKIDTGVGSGSGACNGLSTPVVVDVDNDEIADYAYAGDLKGNLWRFDLTDASAANWIAEPLFQATGPNGEEQPITTQPDAMFHCRGAGYGVLVTFGTGQYLGQSDLDLDPGSTSGDDETQTLYGIWDIDGLWNTKTSAHNWGSVNHSTGALTSSRSSFNDELLKQSVIETVAVNGETYRVVSDNPVYWKLSSASPLPKSHAGWFIDLPNDGERVIADMAIRDFRVIAISMQPSVAPCSSGGTSFVHLLNACSGGRDPLPQMDINGDDEISSEDTVSATIDGQSQDVSPSAIEVQGVAPQPLVLRNPNPDGAKTERLVFPQALISGQGVGGGTPGVVTVRPERRGNYYWREVR